MPHPLERLVHLRSRDASRLTDSEIAGFLEALRQREGQLLEKLAWVRDWKDTLADEQRVRAAAAEEKRRRAAKDQRQAETLRRRQDAAERKHLSDQHAE